MNEEPTIRIVNDCGYWILIDYKDGIKDCAFSVRKEELKPIRDAINLYLEEEK